MTISFRAGGVESPTQPTAALPQRMASHDGSHLGSPRDVSPRYITERTTDFTPTFERWRRELARAEPWIPTETPVVVVVPHPDDEVLMAGGFIRLQRDLRVPVRIVAVTDGEAAYDENGRDEDNRGRLASQRRREQLAALEVLGVGRAHVDRLELPDGDVRDHVDDLANWISGEYPDHVVLAPWVADGHPDHDACGRAANVASARTGAPLWYGFFWMWNRSDPTTPIGSNLRRLDLPLRVARQRQVAIKCHQSQLARLQGAPVLTPRLLEPVRWNAEYYLDASTLVIADSSSLVLADSSSTAESPAAASTTFEEAL